MMFVALPRSFGPITAAVTLNTARTMTIDDPHALRAELAEEPAERAPEVERLGRREHRAAEHAARAAAGTAHHRAARWPAGGEAAGHRRARPPIARRAGLARSPAHATSAALSCE